MTRIVRHQGRLSEKLIDILWYSSPWFYDKKNRTDWACDQCDSSTYILRTILKKGIARCKIYGLLKTFCMHSCTYAYAIRVHFSRKYEDDRVVKERVLETLFLSSCTSRLFLLFFFFCETLATRDEGKKVAAVWLTETGLRGIFSLIPSERKKTKQANE